MILTTSKTFAAGIVAHISRAEQAKRLARRVRAKVLSVDDGTLGATANHTLVLERLYAETKEDPPTYLLVLEDDAIPVRAPLKHFDLALRSGPESIVSFYLGTNFPRYWQPGVQKAISDADAHGFPWIVGDHLLHAVGYAIYRHIVPELVDYLKTVPSLPIDEAITEWARRVHRPVAYTFPSLVDHQDDEPVISHVDGIPRNRPRKAHRFGTPMVWTRKYVRLEYT